jgi:hypothetical protein
MAPPAHPVAVGVKVTSKVTLSPATNTSGRLTEDVVNAGLLAAISGIVTLVVPVFVTVAVKVLVWPTTTAPNGRIAGEHTICVTAALALMGATPRSKIAIPIVSKSTERMKGEEVMDWGSRMSTVWKAWSCVKRCQRFIG